MTEPTAAAEVAPSPPPAAAPAPPPEPVEERKPSVEFCRVTLWRGYRKSRFYAVLAAAQQEVAVAESELFRFRGNGELERTEATEVAHRMMVESLLTERWEIDGEADPWYATRLRRAVSGEAEAPSPSPSS
jgi:hypothetical protein